MYPIRTRSPYDPSKLASLLGIYTTVYLGNYISGDSDENVGSHPGVDIVPMSPNDEVHAVLPGKVEVSAVNASEGEYIVIRHENVPDPSDFKKKTTLFSIYLHLSSRAVEKGDVVAEGVVIGKTGNTGQSTGEHLHFQIDRIEAPFHPYWPFNLSEANEAGLGFFEAVNRGLGIDKGRKFTINPLVYLDAITKSGGVGSISANTTSKVSPEKVVIGSTVASSSFSDVPATYTYVKAVEWVKKQGIASGENGKFRPEAWVTRAELVKMAFSASGRPLSNDIVPHFSDVAANNPFFRYINTAKEIGAVSGYSDGSFRPDTPVTRAEGLKIALSILGIKMDVPSFSPYTDILKSDWVAPYAFWAKNESVFHDSDVSQLHPNAPMKRGEVASLLYSAKM